MTEEELLAEIDMLQARRKEAREKREIQRAAKNAPKVNILSGEVGNLLDSILGDLS